MSNRVVGKHVRVQDPRRSGTSEREGSRTLAFPFEQQPSCTHDPAGQWRRYGGGGGAAGRGRPEGFEWHISELPFDAAGALSSVAAARLVEQLRHRKVACVQRPSTPLLLTLRELAEAGGAAPRLPAATAGRGRVARACRRRRLPPSGVPLSSANSAGVRPFLAFAAGSAPPTSSACTTSTTRSLLL